MAYRQFLFAVLAIFLLFVSCAPSGVPDQIDNLVLGEKFDPRGWEKGDVSDSGEWVEYRKIDGNVHYLVITRNGEVDNISKTVKGIATKEALATLRQERERYKKYENTLRYQYDEHGFRYFESFDGKNAYSVQINFSGSSDIADESDNPEEYEVDELIYTLYRAGWE